MIISRRNIGVLQAVTGTESNNLWKLGRGYMIGLEIGPFNTYIKAVAI
jgi:hypothetical protein